MGRYLTGSIISSFKVTKKRNGGIWHSPYDVKENKEKVLEELSKMINLDFFDMEEIENGFSFKLKEEPLNRYFVDYMEELNTLDSYAVSTFIEHYYGENSNKKIEDIEGKLKIANLIDCAKHEYTALMLEDSEYEEREEYNPFFPDEAYFLRELDGYRGIDMEVNYFVLLFNADKWDGEDEWYMCYLLNRLVRLGLKNPLKDITFFCISY